MSQSVRERVTYKNAYQKTKNTKVWILEKYLTHIKTTKDDEQNKHTEANIGNEETGGFQRS